MITIRNLVRHELIGLKVRIVESKDPGKKGLTGKVVDETRDTFLIETVKGEKRIPKKECTFRFYLDKEKADIPGFSLLSRPEDRIKKKIRKL